MMNLQHRQSDNRWHVLRNGQDIHRSFETFNQAALYAVRLNRFATIRACVEMARKLGVRVKELHGLTVAQVVSITTDFVGPLDERFNRIDMGMML